MADTKPTTVDEYMATLPDDTRKVLQELRRAIQKIIPDGKEKISYAIPCFTLHGRNVVYFSGWKQHVGLYPRPKGDEALAEATAPYVHGRGTLRFPLDKPLPYDLIERVVKALVAETLDGAGY